MAVVKETLGQAKDAYAHLPWHLPDLVEQAPELHERVLDRVTSGGFGASVSKRAFAKPARRLSKASSQSSALPSEGEGNWISWRKQAS